MLEIIVGGFRHARGDAERQPKHRFRRKLGVTQGLLFCLLAKPKVQGLEKFLGTGSSRPGGGNQGLEMEGVLPAWVLYGPHPAPCLRRCELPGEKPQLPEQPPGEEEGRKLWAGVPACSGQVGSAASVSPGFSAPYFPLAPCGGCSETCPQCHERVACALCPRAATLGTRGHLLQPSWLLRPCVCPGRKRLKC